MATLNQMVREFNEVLQAPAGNWRAVISHDTAAFHEAIFGPQQHNEHVKAFKLERKLSGWNVSTADLLADLRRGRA